MSEMINILSYILVAQGVCEVICICFFVSLTEIDKILLYIQEVCEVMYICLFAS